MALVLALLLGAAICVISVGIQCLGWCMGWNRGDREVHGLFCSFLFFFFLAGFCNRERRMTGSVWRCSFERARRRRAAYLFKFSSHLRKGAIVHHGFSRFDEGTHLPW